MESEGAMTEEEKRAIQAYEKGYKEALKLSPLLYSDSKIDTEKEIKSDGYKKGLELLNKTKEEQIEEILKALNQLDDSSTILLSILLLLFREKEGAKLIPHLYSVLADNSQWKEFKTISDLTKLRFDENGNQISSMWDFLLEQLKQKQKLSTEMAAPFYASAKLGTPKYYTSPNTKISNLLDDDNIFNPENDEPVGVAVLDKGKTNQTIITVTATLENTNDFPIKGKPFTEFDRAVHDAIASMYEDRRTKGEQPIFTADMIYRTMTHKAASERVSHQQRASVTESITKMRKNIYIKANCTQEFMKKGIIVNSEGQTDLERYYYSVDDFLLTAKHIENMAVGGGIVDGYLFQEPILLNYAKITKQLLTVNGNVLRIQEVNDKGQPTENTISDTDTRIAIKSYLIRRIEIMRHDEKKATDALVKYNNKRAKDKNLPEKRLTDFRKRSRVIAFDDAFKVTGIAIGSRKTDARKYICQVLDYWKAIKHIKSYKLRKKGKSTDAILIDL